jgi:hypothetical protein
MQVWSLEKEDKSHFFFKYGFFFLLIFVLFLIFCHLFFSFILILFYCISLFCTPLFSSPRWSKQTMTGRMDGKLHFIPTCFGIGASWHQSCTICNKFSRSLQQSESLLTNAWNNCHYLKQIKNVSSNHEHVLLHPHFFLISQFMCVGLPLLCVCVYASLSPCVSYSVSRGSSSSPPST